MKVNLKYFHSKIRLPDKDIYPDFQDLIGYEETTESAMNLRCVMNMKKNNELVRTKTNSGGVSSYRVRCVRCYFFFIPSNIPKIIL